MSQNFSNFFIHSSSFMDKGVSIGEGTQIWHFSHIREYAQIGKHCMLGQNVMVGAYVEIGSFCKIQNNVSIYEKVILKDKVFCGPSCVFTNVLNPRAHIERKNELRITLIEEGVTIGANATIVCGITLGSYCMIGAGAVVTKNVPSHALMVGVPARQIGWVSEAGEILSSDLICPRNGSKYELIEKDSIAYLRKMSGISTHKGV
jgi:UDP-2-acetamido-3-amino-2,3-dideoxy-glucuronate N-acetyltransferase